MDIKNKQVMFLTCAGRTGSGLVHSLLDSHPEILMLPMELKYYSMWQALECDQVTDPTTMRDLWLKKSKLSRLKSGIHYGLEQHSSDYTNCDFDKFSARFEELLGSIELNRTNVFMAIHEAYAFSIGQDLSKVKFVIEFSAKHIQVTETLTDFPEARFIEVMRDCRANFASIKQRHINTRQGLYNFFARKFTHKFTYITIIGSLRSGMEKLAELRRKIGEELYYTIRLEDIHRDPKQALTMLREWMGLADHPTLMQSTLGGVPWKGNSSSGKAVTLGSTEVIDRWKSQLYRWEIMLIEYFFKDVLQRYGYELCFEDKLNNKYEILLWGLLPFRNEFLFKIVTTVPRNERLKKLWNIWPGFVWCIRVFRAVATVVVNIIVYPLNRIFLSMSILKKRPLFG